jgi:hypothetical protein
LQDLLDEDDRAGLTFADQSSALPSLSAAFERLDRYPWHRLYPVTVHPEYFEPIMAAVSQRGGATEVRRWRSELT